MARRIAILSTPFVFLIWSACLPGGIFNKGGIVNGAGVLSSATRLGHSDYDIVCYDQTEALRREKERERALELEERGDTSAAAKISGEVKGPPVRYVPAADYKGGCEEEGEHSMFFIFNIIPVTPPINPHYALSMAVQRLEGDTMINIRTWHETHYYSLLGRAVVYKVRGDVIRFRHEKTGADRKSDEKKPAAHGRKGRGTN